ncbi:MAG: class I adenylate-forming enzyme family protein [Caulobacterales bacterium]
MGAHAGGAGLVIDTHTILAELTGPGTPFEIVARNEGLRAFARTPPNLWAFLESARRFADLDFLVFEGDRLSYAEAFARGEALSGVLGVKPGVHVGIAMSNQPAWVIAFLAVQRAGAVAVLLNSRSAADDLHTQAQEGGVDLILADEKRAGLLREAGYQGRILTPDDFPLSGEPAPASSAGPQDTCAILFTSGTTGRTKGAELTHENLITGLMYTQLSGLVVLRQTAEKLGVPETTLLAHRPQGSALLVFPLFHISGLGAGFLSQMLSGGKIVILPRWEPQRAIELIAAERISMLAGVPTMLWDMIHSARTEGADLSSLRNVSSGGQALPVNLLEAVASAFPGALIGTGFGLTETAGPIAMSIGEEFLARPQSAGRVLALADVRTISPDGVPQAAGAVGELCVRGPMVMKGYFGRPEETRAALDSDGWFRTGDVGFVDDDGFIHIVDRKKDMVISGGENIYCAEVERVMSLLGPVRECAAFGLPDARLGERLVAMVVADGLDEATLRDHVASQLAAYKTPTEVRFSSAPLPRTATGKIDKIALRGAWAATTGEV